MFEILTAVIAKHKISLIYLVHLDAASPNIMFIVLSFLKWLKVGKGWVIMRVYRKEGLNNIIENKACKNYRLGKIPGLSSSGSSRTTPLR